MINRRNHFLLKHYHLLTLVTLGILAGPVTPVILVTLVILVTPVILGDPVALVVAVVSILDQWEQV